MIQGQHNVEGDGRASVDAPTTPGPEGTEDGHGGTEESVKDALAPVVDVGVGYALAAADVTVTPAEGDGHGSAEVAVLDVGGPLVDAVVGHGLAPVDGRRVGPLDAHRHVRAQVSRVDTVLRARLGGRPVGRRVADTRPDGGLGTPRARRPRRRPRGVGLPQVLSRVVLLGRGVAPGPVDEVVGPARVVGPPRPVTPIAEGVVHALDPQVGRDVGVRRLLLLGRRSHVVAPPGPAVVVEGALLAVLVEVVPPAAAPLDSSQGCRGRSKNLKASRMICARQD